MFSRICDLTAQRVVTYIDAHFDEPIAPRDVADALHYSLCYLTHVTRRAIGLSVGELLIRGLYRSATVTHADTLSH